MAIALVAINKKEEKYKVLFTISRLCDKRTNGYSLPEYSDILLSPPGQLSWESAGLLSRMSRFQTPARPSLSVFK